jgi:hypothetical protein
MPPADKIQVENVNVPGSIKNVDAAKYAAMKSALLKVLPKKDPGLTQMEMARAVLPHLPQSEFPGGDKAMWWVKTVQLDLEAKKIIRRDTKAKSTRWSRSPG